MTLPHKLQENQVKFSSNIFRLLTTIAVRLSSNSYFGRPENVYVENIKQNNMLKDWHNKTILIAEDDEISFKYLNLILSRKTGINVLWAINGQIAVDFCRDYQHIDLVMMDIQLPVIDGIEAISQIKSFRPNLPIIVHTANAYGEECERCYAAGCDEYITKPANFQQLLYKIENLLVPIASR
jgi:CheY-like chemotaxis protein